MASAVIGALRVNLSADSAAFSKGLKNADADMKRFAAQAAKVGAAIGAALVGAASVLSVAMKRTIDEADNLGKMAQSVGVPVEELSRLKHAADLSGVSLEGLATSVGRLSRNMSDVAAGAGAEAARAFDALGISVRNTDGTLKSSSQVMTEVAGRFAAMEDGTQKTAIALQLFGRAGMTMIPMLNAGADGMRSMMAEADALGIVITERTAKSAEAFNDNLTRLRAGFDGIVTIVTSAMLPAMENLSIRMVDAANNSAFTEKAANGLTAALKWIVAETYRVAIGFEQMAKEIRLVWELLQSDNWANTTRVWGELMAAGKETQERLAGVGAEVEKLWQMPVNTRISQAFDDIGMKASAAFTPLAAVSEATKKAADEAASALKRMNEEGKRVFEATRTPLEALALEVERLNGLFQAGAIDFETYNRALALARDDFKGLEDAASEVGQTVQSSFSSAFGSLIDGTFDAQKAIQGLLKSLAQLAINNAFTSLIGGFGSSGGGAKATGSPLNLLGFAQGGTILPGGTGGIDGQVVAFRKSPNEQVDIYKPGNDNGAAGGGMSVQIIDQRSGGAAIETQQSTGSNGEPILRALVRDEVTNMAGRKSGRSVNLRPAMVQR